jgi:predicted unusual protein kinase regulating ubiquinone biosynthesis (AarF/ABC1/UbiB family)
VADIPKRAISRSVKLATLPMGIAGRTALGVGKRLGGRPAELVANEIQQRTAEQLFKVLGELKGGAMKFGQALSVFEAALPEDVAGPYRAALTKLQDSAPPMPATAVHKVLTESFGARWRDQFLEWNDQPAAAASIGQVHQAVWQDGRTVAVKLQYPGAGPALLSDLNQLARFARLFTVLNPGLDIKALITELKARVAEELDYAQESESQRAFAAAYAGDPDIFVPKVVAHAGNVIVTEWIDGTPLSAIIRDGTTEQRNRAGLLFVRFLLSGPERCGLLHADPHPGNFRLTADNKLAVLDYGAVNRLPGGMPPRIGPLGRLALDGHAVEVLAGLREEGFVPTNLTVDAQAVLDYVTPMLEPVRMELFHFSRSWLRREAARVADPRSPANALGRQLNLPPTYLLLHRVSTGIIGVLCQLDAEIPYAAEVRRWLPGLAAPGETVALRPDPAAMPVKAVKAVKAAKPRPQAAAKAPAATSAAARKTATKPPVAKKTAATKAAKPKKARPA